MYRIIHSIPVTGCDKMRVQYVFLAVLQGLAVHCFHFAAGGGQNRVGSTGIPFAGWPQPWVDVRVAFGDFAELEGAAGLHQFVGAQFILSLIHI